MTKEENMIEFDGFSSTICPHHKAIVQCRICFDPSTVKDATDWKIKLFHPIMTYRMRKSFREARRQDDD